MPVELYEFGDVTVDLRRVEVRRAGAIVPLEPKSFDVLRHLIENRDRLVAKDELLDAVWKDTFVTPNVLTRAVAQLRKALGDDAFEARYIETVAKRGYRFIAPVRDGENGASNVPGRAAVPTPARRRGVTLAAGLVLVGVLASATWWLSSRDRAASGERTTPLTPRRLSVARDSFWTPDLSPDGSAVAYASGRNGGQDIYVAGLAPGSQERPITTDGGGNTQPAFSPDGRWLAYCSRDHGGLWVVPSTGGVPRQVTDFGSSPSWSPDGQTIVFSSVTEGLSSQGVLWTVRHDGTSRVQLTRAADPPGGHLDPSWSHDGRLIAFWVGRHEQREAWIVPASGGSPRRLAASARRPLPRFSPDDRSVYWIGTTADGIDSLMRTRVNGEGSADGDPETILPFQGSRVNAFSIGRDGTAVFSLLSIAVNLFAVDVDGNGATGAPRQLTFDNAINTYPDYGPTGRVAYQQVVAGRPTTSWLIDDDGRNNAPLSAGLASSVETPQWDPDARRVFVLVTDPGAGPAHFGWMDVTTRQLTPIPMPSGPAAPGKASPPSLSPDGTQLAFHAIGAEGVMNVWIQGLDGSSRRQLTSDREAATYPQWSPDGKWLVVNLKRGDNSQVGVVPVEGGPVEQLTFGRGPNWPRGFSPDSDRIAFSGVSQDVGNIYTVSRKTKEVKQLTHFTKGVARFPTWSPRGNRIVFVHAEGPGTLWTVKLPS